jgi:ketosteroid isomerase-like protein
MLKRNGVERILVATALLMTLGAPLAAAEPAEVLAAFHRALESGDRDAVLDLLLPDIVILESGRAETSLAEYASHHLEADMKFAAATERSVERTWSAQVDGVAWILNSTRTRGTYGEREIDSRGVETVILRRVEGSWRIAHLHWSSRR